MVDHLAPHTCVDSSHLWRMERENDKKLQPSFPDFKQTETNPGGIFHLRQGRACVCHATMFITKTDYPEVENSAQTTSRSSCVSICASRTRPLYMSDDNREKSHTQFQNSVPYSS
jgi:hypothetical protein